MAQSLDCDAAQVAVELYEDAGGFYWHRRVLLINLGSGKWISATPTFGVEITNFGSAVTGVNANRFQPCRKR